MNFPRFILIATLAIALFSACRNNFQPVLNELSGNAQGTTFKILYLGEPITNIESDVNGVFKSMDQSFSLWQEDSYLNEINSSGSAYSLNNESVHLCRLMELSTEMHEMTAGAFDPTIYPLVKAYGFGSKGPELKSGFNLDSVKSFIGWESIRFICDPFSISKPEGFKLDFNAIAQGYTVDELASLLIDYKIENFMIEVGGELFAKGHNQHSKPWTIGVEKPQEERTGSFQSVVTLNNMGLATSGSYRKFYEKEGKLFAHIIDPKTGLPISHNLLSVTIKAPSSAIADALATACMVMGEIESKKFLQENDEIDGLLIFEKMGELKTWESKLFSED